MGKKLVTFGALLFLVGIARSASAGWGMDLICAAVETDPYYWTVYGAVEAAKAAGAISDKNDCLNIGDVLNDFSIPDGTFKDCICDSISWPANPPPPPPACTIAHDICAEGTPLALTMPMQACTTTPEEELSVLVCSSDAYCCTVAWDSQCVSEVSTTFWADAARDTTENNVIQSELRLVKQFALVGAGSSIAGPFMAGLRGVEGQCLSAGPFSPYTK